MGMGGRSCVILPRLEIISETERGELRRICVREPRWRVVISPWVERVESWLMGLSVGWLGRAGARGLRLGSLVCVRILLVRESSGARGAIVGDYRLWGNLMVRAVGGIAFFGRRFGGGVGRTARGGEEK